eukprot:CAMPEP_0183426574 /NCGR_PEP_ID=MMETSP0370-20130417/39779_1 /TAXON_ID=268820 /ORGANISM="Peridinium aciculiferum, Strain PAER-2" /LENGTH=67 /DNA_ID=CAMNT_0025611009 /DNA_START=517 /DNA_END=720 /DNA_ORIENTATION=-
MRHDTPTQKAASHFLQTHSSRFTHFFFANSRSESLELSSSSESESTGAAFGRVLIPEAWDGSSESLP